MARAQQDTRPTAIARAIRVSPQKVNLVLQMIRGQDIDRALDVLATSKKRIAEQVSKLLESAIANAENNHGIDIDRLYVDEAIVGKAMRMRRFRARARGRACKVIKPFSRVTIKLNERKV